MTRLVDSFTAIRRHHRYSPYPLLPGSCRHCRHRLAPPTSQQQQQQRHRQPVVEQGWQNYIHWPRTVAASNVHFNPFVLIKLVSFNKPFRDDYRVRSGSGVQQAAAIVLADTEPDKVFQKIQCASGHLYSIIIWIWWRHQLLIAVLSSQL